MASCCLLLRPLLTTVHHCRHVARGGCAVVMRHNTTNLDMHDLILWMISGSLNSAASPPTRAPTCHTTCSLAQRPRAPLRAVRCERQTYVALLALSAGNQCLQGQGGGDVFRPRQGGPRCARGRDARRARRPRCSLPRAPRGLPAGRVPADTPRGRARGIGTAL
jgi:hypothetical protein